MPILYWHHRYGKMTFRHGSVWCKVDGTWFGQFVDGIGTVINLPLSEVCLYDFQDMFTVVAEVTISI